MKLEHEFEVPASPDVAWEVLQDLGRVASCVPGASLDSVDGDGFAGGVGLKVGPIRVEYAGTGQFVVRDREQSFVQIEAMGKDRRGAGSAKATIGARLAPADGGAATLVRVETDLALTGKVAQLGRGPMNEISAKLMDEFASRLAVSMSVVEEPANPAPAVETAASPMPPSSRRPGEPSEPLDLWALSGGVLLRRTGPPLAGLVVGFVIGVLVTRRVG